LKKNGKEFLHGLDWRGQKWEFLMACLVNNILRDIPRSSANAPLGAVFAISKAIIHESYLTWAVSP
jgi:hypothetical protein